MSAAKASDPSRLPAIKLHGSRKGPIATALARSLVKARRAKSVEADSVVATLAERMALMADAAWRANDPRLYLSASQKLLVLCKSLGLADLSLVIGGDDDDDSGKPRRDPIDLALEQLVGSGPAIRHSKDT